MCINKTNALFINLVILFELTAPKNGAASPPAKAAAAVTVKPGPKQQSPGSTTAATTAKPGAPAPFNKPAVAPGKGIAAAKGMNRVTRFSNFVTRSGGICMELIWSRKA